MIDSLKRWLLPDHPVPMRIWRGPFRGARVVMHPRESLRKAAGLYEHELNGWLETALDRVTRVIDVGANDGYFTFGCVAALRRRGVPYDIVAIEAQARHVDKLRDAVGQQQLGDGRVEILHKFAGRTTGGEYIALDDLGGDRRTAALIKIDVEGAELDVIAGASSWLGPEHLFAIEVHRAEFIDALQTTFDARGLRLTLIRQQPLPIIGAETRDAENWWLVSDLSGR